MSRAVKALAKDLSLPIIVLSQLNRESDKGKGQRPRLSDLRDSGAIEQDADIVGLLHRPDPEGNTVELLLEKHRNGPTGKLELYFAQGSNPVHASDTHRRRAPQAEGASTLQGLSMHTVGTIAGQRAGTPPGAKVASLGPRSGLAGL